MFGNWLQFAHTAFNAFASQVAKKKIVLIDRKKPTPIVCRFGIFCCQL